MSAEVEVDGTTGMAGAEDTKPANDLVAIPKLEEVPNGVHAAGPAGDIKTEVLADAKAQPTEHADDSGPEADDAAPDSDDEDALELSYEEERQATIRANAELLASLGLQADAIRPHVKAVPKAEKVKATSGTQPERRSTRVRTPAQPARRSARIEKLETEHKALPQDWDDRQIGSKRKRGAESEAVSLPKSAKVAIPPAVKYTGGEDSASEDEIEEKRQPLPVRREDGTRRLVFEGRWKDVFEPNLTPREVFAQGAFGGAYYADDYSYVNKTELPSKADLAELPAEWFTEPDAIDPSTRLTASTPEPTMNRYGVRAGQGLREWEKSGWIWHADPRGWMQWYTRFYYGRRSVDDERQVQRWLNLAGPSGRFSRSLMKKIASATGGGGAIPGNTALDDEDVGRVLRQVNHQWAWVLNRAEWERRVSGV